MPLQWKRYYAVMQKNEGPVYFAGEHLSVHHAWIEGSLESSDLAVGQMLKDHAERMHHKRAAAARITPAFAPGDWAVSTGTDSFRETKKFWVNAGSEVTWHPKNICSRLEFVLFSIDLGHTWLLHLTSSERIEEGSSKGFGCCYLSALVITSGLQAVYVAPSSLVCCITLWCTTRGRRQRGSHQHWHLEGGR